MDLCVQEGALCMIAVSNSSDWCWKYVNNVLFSLNQSTNQVQNLIYIYLSNT